MKLGKRFRLIIILAILFTSLAVFLTQVDSVQATFTDVHAAMVLIRFETDIMQKTPAGRYYESLYWKYNDELTDIARKFPEHRVDFSNVTRMFIPGMEALLNGRGDKVYVTPKQIDALKAELAWFASVGSPALREDIERELRRFPLDQFIGMTMSEAQDFVDSTWAPGSMIEKSLVSNSEGAWAYYEYKGVYFEYPSGYNLQISETQENYIYLIPARGMPDYWNPCIVKVYIQNVSPNEKDKYNPRSWYSLEHILWERDVQNANFPGVNFATFNPDYPVSYIYAFQYNAINQVAVRMSVFLYQNSEAVRPLEYPETMSQQYEYFQHMIDSLRIQ